MCDIQAEYYMEQVEWIALDSGPGVEQGLISYLLCLNRYLVKTRTATMDAKAADLFFDICIREMILYSILRKKIYDRENYDRSDKNDWPDMDNL